jgi:hypothetical protein
MALLILLILWVQRAPERVYLVSGFTWLATVPLWLSMARSVGAGVYGTIGCLQLLVYYTARARVLAAARRQRQSLVRPAAGYLYN